MSHHSSAKLLEDDYIEEFQGTVIWLQLGFHIKNILAIEQLLPVRKKCIIIYVERKKARLLVECKKMIGN